MARNTGNGTRVGIITNRTQTYNPKTKQYVKRDTTTGQIISCKDTPYKAVRREDNILKQSHLPPNHLPQSSTKISKKNS